MKKRHFYFNTTVFKENGMSKNISFKLIKWFELSNSYGHTVFKINYIITVESL